MTTRRRPGDILPQVGSDARIEFGSTNVEFVPAAAINDLRQIREAYDLAELQQLADRIPIEEHEGAISFTLINPPTIAVFEDDASARDYVLNHALYYGIEFETDPIVELETWNGAYHIRVNGHRRGHAIELKCRQEGLPIESVMVSSTLLHSPTFDEARRQQYIENTSSAITPVEDAKAIEREYVWRWHSPSGATIDPVEQRRRVAELSEFFGFGPEKIKAALYFISMPEDITVFVKQGLSYTNIVDLARLREAYLAQKDYQGYQKHTLEQAERRMRDYFESIVLKRLRGGHKGTIAGAIDGKIREVIRTTAYEADELFLIDEVGEATRAREKVRRDITDAALLALKFSDLRPEDAEKLLTIATERLAELAVDDAFSTQDELFQTTPESTT